MQLGLVTYLLGKDWDVATLIENCTNTGFQGVELRSTHAHGVESDLSNSARSEIKKQFMDSPVELVGLGTAFEFHSPDKQILQNNIAGAKQYASLAHDVGATGIKVRPNGISPNVPIDKTLEQIGMALNECAQFASGYGVAIRLEVHGRTTSQLSHIQTIMEIADHPEAVVCWNCNPTDLVDKGLESNFQKVSKKIGMVHTHDLFDPQYPYQQLFDLLVQNNYDGYCLAECPASSDPVRVMHYYRALFAALHP